MFLIIDRLHRSFIDLLHCSIVVFFLFISAMNYSSSSSLMVPTLSRSLSPDFTQSSSETNAPSRASLNSSSSYIAFNTSLTLLTSIWSGWSLSNCNIYLRLADQLSWFQRSALCSNSKKSLDSIRDFSPELVTQVNDTCSKN